MCNVLRLCVVPLYTVIHKALRDFRTLRYSSRDGHAEGEHVSRGRDSKKTWRDSLPIDMLLFAVSVLVVALPISEVPEGIMNYPVYSPQQAPLFSTRVAWHVSYLLRCFYLCSDKWVAVATTVRVLGLPREKSAYRNGG